MQKQEETHNITFSEKATRVCNDRKVVQTFAFQRPVCKGFDNGIARSEQFLHCRSHLHSCGPVSADKAQGWQVLEPEHPSPL